jgi:excisionase family DNA binding protein
MTTEELIPRSQALREALDRYHEHNTDNQMLLNIREACRRLKISKWTLYRLMNERRLTYVKIGSRRLISSRAMAEFIKQLEDETNV